MQATFFTSSGELRDWFETNHGEARELLIGFYKTKSGKGGMTYQQALDEALCFGWIDGVRRSLGDEAWTIRFTPRKRGSVWSAVNIKRAHELSSLGLMRSPGLAAFETRDERKANQYSYEQKTVQLDPAYQRRLRRNAEAWTFFHKQAPSYQRACLWWVMSAKREETRLKRLATLIKDSQNGRRIGPLTPPAARNER